MYGHKIFNSFLKISLKLDRGSSLWRRKGFCTFKVLFVSGIFDSFTQFSTSYNLLQSDLIGYFQVTNFVITYTTNFTLSPPPLGIANLLGLIKIKYFIESTLARLGWWIYPAVAYNCDEFSQTLCGLTQMYWAWPKLTWSHFSPHCQKCKTEI